jgi:hypothetical protein
MPGISKRPVVEAFTEWLSISYNPDILNSLPDSPLFRKVIDLLREREYVEQAAECLLAVVDTIASPGQDQRIYGFMLQVCFKINQEAVKGMMQHEEDMAEDLIQIVIAFACRFARPLI